MNIMPLTSGTRLGPYEILSPVGAGGMGEVYKARDTRLDRSVAVKVSSAQFTERFAQEARAVAAFNHPNICTLYDVGPDYLVMEYIEGTPVKGPMPLPDALRVAAQIADALDAAHRKGIIHRDLKPANILITKAGVKLLDFGHAKQTPASRAAAAETVTRAITAEGSIVGTLQYMAPEQLQGKEADARSDIFAFGCVLYEMLAGRRAFAADDSASIIASILKEDPPPMIEVAPLTPPALDRLLRKCLAKDPDDRWQSARDLRDEIQWIASGGAVAVVTPAKSAAVRKWERWCWIGAIAALASLATFAIFKPKPQSRPPVMRFHLTELSAGRPIAISPDGRNILFASGAPTEAVRLSVYSLSSTELRPLVTTSLVRSPKWTPDSREVLFTDGRQLRKVDIATGAVITVQNDVPRAAISDSDGSLLFATPRGIESRRADGSAPRQLTRRQANESWQDIVQVLPNGNFLFNIAEAGVRRVRVFGGFRDGRAAVKIVESSEYPTYVDPGYLLYLKGDTLLAQPFDVARMAFRAAPTPLVDGTVSFSASQNGTVLYQPGTHGVQSHLTWFDRTGKPLGTLGDAAEYTNPALSPDGTRLALDVREAREDGRDIWIYDLQRASRTRFTTDPGDDFDAVWSPDGLKIAFGSRRDKPRAVYWKDTGGINDEQLLLSSNTDEVPEHWSPDGRYISILKQGLEQGLLLFSVADHKLTPVRQPRFRDQGSQFSPHSRFLAYRSFESGRNEVYVQALPPAVRRWQISTGGGDEPQWRRDGKELFFVSADNYLMSVGINIDGDRLNAGIPKALFKVPPSRLRRNRYVVTPDGQRFLVIVPEERQPQPLTVLLNWPSLLPKAP